MTRNLETVDEQARAKDDVDPAEPGLVVTFSVSAAHASPLRLGDGLVVGREHEHLPEDDHLSRKHARIDRIANQWRIRDLGSRNGTFVDGSRIDGGVLVDHPRVIRIGRTLLLPVTDVRPFEALGVRHESTDVEGPLLQSTMRQVTRSAEANENLLVVGESGAGKERLARAFQRGGPRKAGPLVTVNCATIPHGLAERLLLGSRRGAFSGATDTEGYVRAADRGVLFLDEIGELEPDVQAKLLRVIEAREVLPLGATRAQPVDVRFCFATNRDLRSRVAEGAFRADLFYRIEQPSVRVPPLRERPEELAWLVCKEVERAQTGVSVRASLIEACLLREWPGNVRELMQHARRAASVAHAAGATHVSDDHLDPHAGKAVIPNVARVEDEEHRPHTPDELRQALDSAGGNVSAAARKLRLHRTQLRRLMQRFGIAIKDDA